MTITILLLVLAKEKNLDLQHEKIKGNKIIDEFNCQKR